MGRDGLKVDWKSASKAALAAEGENWDDYKWQSARRRLSIFKHLRSLMHRDPKFLGDWKYYKGVLRPDFGPSHALLGLSKPRYTERESLF